LVCGPLSDRHGRRPVLLAGLIVFTVASVGCSGCGSLPLLILLRLMQGIGASVGPIIARAIVRDQFEHVEGTIVLSHMTQIMILAPLLAPTIGALLLVWSGWPAIFVLLAAIGLTMLVVCGLRLGESRKAPGNGGAAPFRLAATFLTVLSHRSTVYFILIVCLAYSGMFAYISGSPLVVMSVYHVSKPLFGLVFASTAVFIMLGAVANRAGLRRHTPDRMLRRGLGILLLGGLAIALAAKTNMGGLYGVIVPMMVYLFGMGIAMPNAIAAAMAPHPTMAGVTSSLIGATQTVGGALAGVCVAGLYQHSSASLAYTVAICAALACIMQRLSPSGPAQSVLDEPDGDERFADAELESEQIV